MRKKIILCLIAVMILVSGCSTASTGSNPVLEFFGFNRPVVTPTVPSPEMQGSEQQAQNVPHAEDDPFGTESKSLPESGSGLSDLDWDDFDPALVDTDEEEIQSKENGSEEDNWADDPNAWSFSESTYDSSVETGAQKQANVAPSPTPFVNPVPVYQAPNNQNPVDPAPVNPAPYVNIPNPPANQPPRDPYTFYRLMQNPVFRPMCELPRTGFPTGKHVDVVESVRYASTNMSLSIPALNVTEDIVIVPLVDDNFPVEALGEKIGLLEGSGPGPEDLFVLAAHNHLNTQEPGPFLELSALKDTDLIFVNGAKDASRTFVVYANEKFASDDIEGLASYVKPGCMILITCEDESIEGGYINRRVIFAEPKEN